MNNFQLDLNRFRDLKDLAGRGLTICEDVEIGAGGRRFCTAGSTLACVKLGWTDTAEQVVPT